MKKLIFLTIVLLAVFFSSLTFPEKSNVYQDSQKYFEVQYPENLIAKEEEDGEKITFTDHEYGPALATIIIDADVYRDFLNIYPEKYKLVKTISQTTYRGDLYEIYEENKKTNEYWLFVRNKERTYLVAYRPGGEWIIRGEALRFTR